MTKYKEKMLVEDCAILELAHFPKGFLHFTKKSAGRIRLTKLLTVLDVNFEIVPRRVNPYIELNFLKNRKQIKQVVYHDYGNVNLGSIRPYLLCECGYRANKLYMPLGGRYQAFKCRKCHELRYELTTINRKALGNDLFYRANRLMKLQSMEAKYITYGDKLTKKAMAFISMSNKWLINTAEREKIDVEIAGMSGKSQFI